MKREREFDKSIFLLLIMMSVIIVAALYIYFQVRTDKISELVHLDSTIPVVFIVSEEGRPLITELFLFYPETGKGSLLDIPGNTRSIIRELKKMDRIDSLFVAGNVEGYVQKIAEMTELEIPFYMVLSLDALSDIVDLIDGLQLFIANPIDVKTDKQTVLLPSGSVDLDGSKLQSYLKYSINGESDAERIDRNQKFTKSFLEKLAFRKVYLSNDDVYRFLKEKISTNMSRKSFENFLTYIDKLDTDMLIYQKVLGVKRVVDSQELLFPHYDARLLKEMITQTKENLTSIRSFSRKGPFYSVQVLNGTDKNGLALRTAQVLKSFGYKIAGIGDAIRIDKSEYSRTVILDRRGNPDGAKSLADLIKSDNWFSEADSSLDDTIDITLILGRDFDGRYVK